MAEIVQRHVEEMIVEIEAMEALKLFTIEERRQILKKWKYYEYKLLSASKDLQDLTDYIQHEEDLLKNVLERRRKFRVEDKKSNIEHRIIKRIKRLYELVIQREPNNFPRCLAYFNFCNKFKYHQSASLVVEHMVKAFSHYPEAWQVAAEWHKKKNINQALNIIHKGLAMNKNNQMLFIEAIKLELLGSEKETVICTKITSYVELFFKIFNDYKFMLEVLSVLESSKITTSIQDMIIRWLMEHHSNEVMMWHALAQREKRGLHFDLNAGVSSYNFCLQRCVQKYKEGLEKVPSDAKEALWGLYLDDLLTEKEKKRKKPSETNLRKELTVRAFQDAEKEIKLAEKYYLHWVMLLNDPEEATALLQKALQALPQSLDLWSLRLKLAIANDSTRQFNIIFKKAITNLKENSGRLWLMAIKYYYVLGKNDTIELVYQDGLKQPSPICDMLKPEYIEWLALTKGITEARNAYYVLANQEPYCKDLHTKMIQLESVELFMPDLEHYENVYKLACSQFGKEDVNLWISYREFYIINNEGLSMKNPDFNLSEKLTEILKEAENNLKNKRLLAELKRKANNVNTLEIGGPSSSG